MHGMAAHAEDGHGRVAGQTLAAKAAPLSRYSEGKLDGCRSENKRHFLCKN